MFYIGDPEYKEGEQFNGGGFRSIPGEEEWGAIRAFQPATGDLKWECELTGRAGLACCPQRAIDFWQHHRRTSIRTTCPDG